MNEQQITAMELAFKALDIVKIHYTQNRHVNEAIAAIKEALAQPELCKYGQERKSCTSSPMDCQCVIDAALAQDALQALHDENKSLGLYEKGYADAMNWKVQNHLEHLPSAQPKQKPVAWMTHEVSAGTQVWLYEQTAKRYQNPPTPLYVTPQPPQRKPLTDEEIFAIGKELGLTCRLGGNSNIDIDYARAIETAHGIKE